MRRLRMVWFVVLDGSQDQRKYGTTQFSIGVVAEPFFRVVSRYMGSGIKSLKRAGISILCNGVP